MKTFQQFLSEAKFPKYSHDQVVYHGTSREFHHFDPNAKRHEATPHEEAIGHFFTPDRNLAHTYASRAAKADGGKQRVISANLHFQNPKDVTGEVKKHQKAGLPFSQAKRKAYGGVDRTKHDGIIFHGNAANPPEYVAFHNDSIKQL
jgi:hypothetical protein